MPADTSVPSMGDNLAVKVHYTDGSRKCGIIGSLYGLLEIKDISPIAGLKSLEKLYLMDLESVNDISAISNLKNKVYI